MLFLYSFLLTVGFILMLPIFLLRRGKYAAGFWQRLGYLPDFAPEAGPRVVWLHAVSVGETNAARPLVEALKKQYPEHRFIVSTTTRTGQNLAREIFKGTAETVFYFPFDWKFAVRRALAHFQPDVVLLVETEIWFRFLREAAKSGAQTAIVNGRLSEKSFRNFSYIKNFMRRVLADVDLALMQTDADAERLVALGIDAGKVKVTGNIKFDLSLTEKESGLTEEFRARFAISTDAPLILAASTHAPEERRILEAFKRLDRDAGAAKPRLLLVPRHPERFDEVAEMIGETGLEWARRSAAHAARDKNARVILLDSIGELRAAYALAEIVFVGGSLIPHGGQSVLEPAAAGKAIVTGHYTTNFAAAVREFLNRDALIQLPEADEQYIVEQLARVFRELLDDAEKRRRMGDRARAVMQTNRGATGVTLENLKPLLER